MGTGTAISRRQGDCRFPQGQWPGDPQRVRELRQSLSPDGSAGEGERRDRRQQVQSGQQSRSQFYTREDRSPARAARGECGRYLSQLDTADRQEPSDVLVLKTTRLKEK